MKKSDDSKESRFTGRNGRGRKEKRREEGRKDTTFKERIKTKNKVKLRHPSSFKGNEISLEK